MVKNILHIVIFLILACCSIVLTAQQEDSTTRYYLVDSLDFSTIEAREKVLLDTSMAHYHKAKSDTERLSWVMFIAEQSGDDHIWPKYNDLTYQLAKEQLGSEDLPEKIVMFYKHALALALNNKGYYYNNVGDISSALDYYHESLDIREEMGDEEGIASSLNNMGIIYDNQGNSKKALKAYSKSLEIFKKLNNESGIATLLNNVGYVYDNQHDTTKALGYYNESLRLYRKLEDDDGIATCLNNIGSIYAGHEKFEQALAFHQESLRLREKLDDQPDISYSLNNIGGIYQKLGDLKKAEEYSLKSLQIAQSIGYPENIRNAAKKLFEIYKSMGDYQKSLKNYELYVTMKDSITNVQTQRKAVEQDAKHAYEKQKAMDDKEHEKMIAVELEKEARQRVVIIATIIVLILTVIFLAFVFQRLKIARKQRNLIREQNQKLNVVNREISEQRDEMVASINYAKLIQNALLPLEEYERDVLPDHFIIYKPKDIVSGDFYWFFKKENIVYIAVVDCTGHGVPGGFLTMLGTSFLNEINSTSQVLSPAKILNKLREKIITDLSQADGKNKDGMDISLLKLDRENYSAEWAGAHNPLYFINPENEHMEVMKGDRQPIGYTEAQSPFTNHKVKLQKGSLVYLFTDGYADQFSSKSGKKIGYKRFRDELYAIQKLPMNEQKAYLISFFEEWKGNESQIDDVCVIGLRL